MVSGVQHSDSVISMHIYVYIWASLVAQTVKNQLAMEEMLICITLGWEFLLEKEMAIHSSILAWRIPWTEKPGRLQSMGSPRVGRDYD